MSDKIFIGLTPKLKNQNFDNSLVLDMRRDFMIKRDSLSLRVEILQRASQNGGIKKTHLIQGVGFNSSQLNDHLNNLISGEYLREEGRLYAATDKGKAFLGEYYRLVDEGFGDILGQNNGKEHLPEQSKRLPPRLLVYSKT